MREFIVSDYRSAFLLFSFMLAFFQRRFPHSAYIVATTKPEIIPHLKLNNDDDENTNEPKMLRSNEREPVQYTVKVSNSFRNLSRICKSPNYYSLRSQQLQSTTYTSSTLNTNNDNSDDIDRKKKCVCPKHMFGLFSPRRAILFCITAKTCWPSEFAEWMKQ